MDVVDQVKAAEQKALREKDEARSEAVRLYEQTEAAAHEAAAKEIANAKKEAERMTLEAKEQAIAITAKIGKESTDRTKELSDSAIKKRDMAAQLILSHL